MAHSIKKEVTFEGLKYNLDERDRVAAYSSHVGDIGVVGNTLFKWNYINCGAPLQHYGQTTANNVTADGYISPMMFPGQNGETFHTNLCRIGAVTTDLESPVIEGTVPATDTMSTAAGLNMQMDQDTAADLGWEMTFGPPHGNTYSSFVAGSDSGYIDISVFAAQWTSYDAVTIGFRKAEAYQTGHAPIVGAGTGDPVYTDFITFGLQESDKVQAASDLNNGGSGTYTDMDLIPWDSENQRFRVTLAKTGVATYQYVSQSVANSGTLVTPTSQSSYTFDSGDTLIPYITVHGKDNADTALLFKHIEVHRDQNKDFAE